MLDERWCEDPFVNQACAELAFAKSMGWDDWKHDEESEEGMVRGFRVRWAPDPSAGLLVDDDGDDDVVYVLVTGWTPTFEIHGGITLREAKKAGRRIRVG
jgi:hypothetical protein